MWPAAVGDAPRALSMSPRSVGSISAAGHTQFTRPMARASAALTSSFSRASSLARPSPTRRASLSTAPSGISPCRVAPSPMTASSAATRRSQASASCRPPPMEYPCSTATVIFGMSSRPFRARIQ
ncbi:MAG: hypothetical protein AUH29_08860 [Candidatus Rokubacteria bacterium 13_1_40CM_69_27]|nr:MAG: hypothetical protein AUH29_08860 [Candidatus Rokubacteria bacterium 13_1_40CM_69_27]